MPIRTFQNRVAVITGGASGIGLALADKLAERGCHLALADCRADRLQTAQQCLAAPGRILSTHCCDVADSESVETLKNEVLQSHGSVHLLVTSAGVSLAGRFLDTDLNDFRWIIETNFWGTVLCCKAFLPILLQQEEGHIVTLCSSFGLLGFAGKTGYSASKFAVRGFSEALRMELDGTPVGLTVVYPGPVNTNIVRDGRATNVAQRETEADFLARRALPAARVADRVIHSIRKNTPRLLLSADYRLIDWMTRFSPTLAQKLAARVARKLPF